MLSVNDSVPQFKAKISEDTFFTDSDFLGKKTVLYFYPKDDTPGCTVEANDFTNLSGDFAKKGYSVIGVSKDSCGSHEKFIKKHNLKVMLLSDEDGSMCQAFGTKGMVGITRTTFVIDEKGTISQVYNNVKATGHAQKVLDSLS